ncbi:hypothetical protein [Ruminococcus gauvreauii]|uniref:Uncharacterized protein n=1 Tax=Ruminococcus gauvreauii TaxID=438033 RepID=A0ABY5VG37_9FIRM|nr:hypothetical protein [Ruminococcus gauvreauii]UWP59359.1 hypothetical protein NQ502_18705 [Ruminococcus gauvreauii]
MKKLVALGAAAALIFTTGTFAFGAGADTAGVDAAYCETNGYYCRHVTDENLDGVCDNCQDHTAHDSVHSHHSSEKTDSSCSSAAGRHASRHDHGRHHN